MSRAQIPWLRLAAEGGAIIASILLALAADSWIEARARDAQYRDVVRALEVDFGQAREAIQILENINRSVLATADSISVLLDGVDESGSASVSSCTLVTLLRTPTLDLPTGELQSLIGSGELALIQDRDLRRQLAEWPSAVSDVDDKSVRHSAFVYEQLIPELRRVLPLQPLVDHRFAPDLCVAEARTIEVPATPEVRNLIEHLRLMPMTTVNAYSWERILDLLESIEVSLDRVLTS